MATDHYGKPESDISQTASSSSDTDDVEYVTSFKLALIMITINLSTLVTALDLVSTRSGTTLAET
jgi:hypothetical protein